MKIDECEPSKLELLHAEFFGPGYAEALDYLEERGFYLDRELRWHAPHDLRPTPKDVRAMLFLAIEWGYSADVIRDEEVIPPICRLH